MSVLPSGTMTDSGTLTAGTVATVQFADRYDYIALTNIGTTAIYATADGSTPTGSGAGCGEPVEPGQTGVLANGLPFWDQSSNAIAHGEVIQGEVQPFMSSLAGQETNPGTTVKLISTGTPGWVIAAAG
jgi:hypothetical protein